ncbi:hypothetical protein [Candidatus Sororendozoicomonas aggregata]|uniref:hypothetical protein n=1 Tax=Candidatus Sororendozoicomonas aggregata TaxID=3073239 RepID=UPI002ED526A2
MKIKPVPYAFAFPKNHKISPSTLEATRKRDLIIALHVTRNLLNPVTLEGTRENTLEIPLTAALTALENLPELTIAKTTSDPTREKSLIDAFTVIKLMPLAALLEDT